MASYLDRYLAGEREQVWAELQVLGERVREEPLYADALSVARVTMRRARANLEVLIPRLRDIGYVFDSAWQAAQARVWDAWLEETSSDLATETLADDEEHPPAAREDESPDPVLACSPSEVSVRLEELDRRVGPLPVSVRAWYEVVGAVNLVGLAPRHLWPKRTRSKVAASVPKGIDPLDWQLVNHAGWTCALDPLALWGIERAIDESFRETSSPSEHDAMVSTIEEWGWTIEGLDEEPDSDSDVIRMGLDQNLKYGISGSRWAGVRTPDAKMDGLFFNDAYRAPFIDYLRLCFRWGGLPGLRDPALRSAEVERDLRYLTAGLLPL